MNDAKAFICYRRSDSFNEGGDARTGTFVHRMKTALESIGFTDVFLDTDPRSGAQPSDHYEDHAHLAIEECDLFVALIGTKWLSLQDMRTAEGRRDATAREIRAALKYDKEILPILVDDAVMPADNRLRKDISDFQYRSALTIPSSSTVEQIADRIRAPAAEVLEEQRLGKRWTTFYIAAAVSCWVLCAAVPNLVGALEYGIASWVGMAKMWAGFFIWPAIFLPFVLIAFYRPLTTIISLIAKAPTFRRAVPFLWPLALSTAAAVGGWFAEVYDRNQVPWTISPALGAPGCGSTAVHSSAERSANDADKAETFSRLSSYDAEGHLRQQYAPSQVPFWLTSKCWPRVLFYLTVPIYHGKTSETYSAERTPIQKAFVSILDDKTRIAYGVPNSMTAYAYRVSFSILVWLAVTGIMLAAYFSAAKVRDPSSDRLTELPAEDAVMCLTYSLAILATWIPFRMITGYFKYLYACYPGCTFDLSRHLPDLLAGALISIGFVFTTVGLLGRYRRIALSLFGTLLVCLCAVCAFFVYRFPEQVARLADNWQFYVIIVIPAAIVTAFLWMLFDPSRVHLEDFRKDLE